MNSWNVRMEWQPNNDACINDTIIIKIKCTLYSLLKTYWQHVDPLGSSTAIFERNRSLVQTNSMYASQYAIGALEYKLFNAIQCK